MGECISRHKCITQAATFYTNTMSLCMVILGELYLNHIFFILSLVHASASLLLPDNIPKCYDAFDRFLR